MLTTVVNLYKEPFDVYIGRPGKGQDGYFGNPAWEGAYSREEKISRFEKYFHNRMSVDPEFARRVLGLKGKRLGCFCKPQPCHGDIIAEYLNKIPDVPKMKFAVIGSREFQDYDYLKEILQHFPISDIISGGAKGADSLAAKYAVENNIKLTEFLPDWDLHGKSAGYIRNEKIITACDEVIAFWNGISKGTKHSIDIASKQSKPVHVFWKENKRTSIDDEISILG